MPANQSDIFEISEDEFEPAQASSHSESEPEEEPIKKMPSTSQQWFISHPSRNQHETFIKDSLQIFLKYLFDGTSRSERVLTWMDPELLQQTIDFKLHPLPETHPKLISLMNDVIKYSVKTGHPYFVNQLFSGIDPYGLVGQWLTDILNPSVYTYEVSPVFTLMEEEVLREMRQIVGYPNGYGDGIFCPGGSMANGYAISCARFHCFPEIKVI